MDSFENFLVFFTLLTEKVGLYVDISKKNIRYSKLLQDTKYGKLIKNTQEKFDSNENNICSTSTTSITLIDFQELKNIGGQENTPMFGIQFLEICLVFSI